MEALEPITEEERRSHRRLAIRLPLECRRAESDREQVFRAVTSNISTGGLYFELDLPEGAEALAARSQLNVDLTVPPGEGHFPYQGRLSSVAEVLRCEPLTNGHASTPGGPRRIGVAAQFCEALKLAF